MPAGLPLWDQAPLEGAALLVLARVPVLGSIPCGVLCGQLGMPHPRPAVLPVRSRSAGGRHGCSL